MAISMAGIAADSATPPRGCRGVFLDSEVQWHCGVAGMLGRRPIGGLNLPELDGKRNKNDKKKTQKKKREKKKKKENEFSKTDKTN